MLGAMAGTGLANLAGCGSDRCFMNEQLLAAVRGLPRQRLEDLTIRMMSELKHVHEDASPNTYFLAVLMGFISGATTATAGMIVGNLMH